MESFTNLGGLNGLGIVAALIFLGVWLGISWWIEHPTAKHPSVTVLMSEYRRKWMLVMIAREPRVFDAQMMTSLRQGTSFFASTSLLAMGGLLALIGNVDPLQNVTMQIGHLETAAMELQTKLILVLVLLGNAFLKFVWANRVFGYCSVMMGAVPNDPADPQAIPLARKAAELNIRAAMNFNRGLRSMYFSLGAVAWVAGAWALLAACLVIGLMVWSREFASVPREIILNDVPDTKA